MEHHVCKYRGCAVAQLHVTSSSRPQMLNQPSTTSSTILFLIAPQRFILHLENYALKFQSYKANTVMVMTMLPGSSNHSQSHSIMSKFLSKIRSKRKSKPDSQQETPKKPRPPLRSSPLPLVLPEHQQAFTNLGWTTLTFPSPAGDSDPVPSPGPHPLKSASIALFHAAQVFFDQPDEAKVAWKHRLGTEEGWSKIPGEKEFITLRTLAYTPDVLKDPARRYWELMGGQLSSSLGRVSASLGLPDTEDAGLRKFVGPCSIMGEKEEDKTATMLRIFRYEASEAKIVAEPHADLGLMSAVVGDVPGLEVWDGKQFFGVEKGYDRGQATVLAGRQLERLSNFRYPAGGHRVVAYGDDKPQDKAMAETEGKPKFRHSIVFVLRAHEPVMIESSELETDITGKWVESISGITAGILYDEIKKRHFNINIGMEEREKQRRLAAEAKNAKSKEEAKGPS